MRVSSGLSAASRPTHLHEERTMDDSTFDFDTSAVATASARFPARRLAPSAAPASTGLSYLARPNEFGEHAWDESGH